MNISQAIDNLFAKFSRTSQSNVAGDTPVAIAACALISPASSALALQVLDDGSIVASASGTTLVSAAGALAPAALALPRYTVSSGFGFPALSTITSPVNGQRVLIIDATSPTFLGTLTGGGSVSTPAFYNGAAWVAG